MIYIYIIAYLLLILVWHADVNKTGHKVAFKTAVHHVYNEKAMITRKDIREVSLVKKVKSKHIKGYYPLKDAYKNK